MKLRSLSLVLALTVAGSIANAQSAKPASDILNAAYKTAAKEEECFRDLSRQLVRLVP